MQKKNVAKYWVLNFIMPTNSHFQLMNTCLYFICTISSTQFHFITDRQATSSFAVCNSLSIWILPFARCWMLDGYWIIMCNHLNRRWRRRCCNLQMQQWSAVICVKICTRLTQTYSHTHTHTQSLNVIELIFSPQQSVYCKWIFNANRYALHFRFNDFRFFEYILLLVVVLEHLHLFLLLPAAWCFCIYHLILILLL